ncbi:MAG: CDP-alcohol phosphatidyltransferase family protein [Gemmatimonadaceae bacterium]|nr:CDP-alcohol phosphatidyltransferase family protein [Gemmatimonadaceae bacterium]
MNKKSTNPGGFLGLSLPVAPNELPPVAITAFRIGLFPLLTLGPHFGLTAAAAAWVVGAGFFSDVIDGYVARWLRVSNAMIRGFDSFADTVFYLAALYALFYFRLPVISAHRALIVALIATQLLEHLVELRKFGKPASYHAMSAKVWGVTLPIALITVLLSGRDDFLVLALVAGFISHADCFIITCILPEWRHDVATAYDALAIRRSVSARITSAT